MKNSLRLTALLIIAVAVAGAGFAISQEKGKADEQALELTQAAPRPVLIQKVQRLRGSDTRSYPGIIRSSQEADLAFRVGGPLISQDCQVGSRVHAGDVLMRIDPRDFTDRVQVLEAQLAGALASQENARLTLRRTTPLLSQRVVSQSDYDNAKSAYDAAAASVKGLRAQLEIARHQVQDTTLKAPFDGIVTALLVDNHEMVGAGQTVITMHDISRLEIDVDVPENEILFLDLKSLGQEALVSLPSLPGLSFPATLTEWSAQAAPDTRTYTVTFALKAPEDVILLPGMTAQVAAISPGATSREEQPLAIPAGAVATDKNGNTIVWVYDEQSATAKPRIIETGPFMGGDRAVIMHGLEEGELVVAAGLDFITEDMLLRPLGENHL